MAKQEQADLTNNRVYWKRVVLTAAYGVCLMVGSLLFVHFAVLDKSNNQTLEDALTGRAEGGNGTASLANVLTLLNNESHELRSRVSKLEEALVEASSDGTRDQVASSIQTTEHTKSDFELHNNIVHLTRTLMIAREADNPGASPYYFAILFTTIVTLLMTMTLRMNRLEQFLKRAEQGSPSEGGGKVAI